MRIDNKQISSLSEVATRFPKSYAKISAAFGQDARQFFQAFDVDTAQVSTANRLLRELIDAAPNGGPETQAHADWRASIARIEALVKRLAGAGSIASATAGNPIQLAASIKQALKRTDFPAGTLPILQALQVPGEPANDAKFNEALAAAKLFFL